MAAIVQPAARKLTSREIEARQRRNAALYTLGVRGASLAIVLGAWEYFGRGVNNLTFTYPSAVVAAFGVLIGNGELWKYLSDSLQVLLYGLSIGTVVGILLGLVMGRWRPPEMLLQPLLFAFNSMPLVALLPLLVMWFGIGVQGKVVAVFLFTFFPLVVNSFQGVKSVDPRLLEVARSFSTDERRLWGDVLMPSAMPFIVTGFRQAISRGLIGMVAADLQTALTGIGYMIVRYSNSYQMDKTFVPVITLAIIALVLVQGLRIVERRLQPWTQPDTAV
jgi:ABC-type nitrate/sulfonate/bicarbonate transport system permease component